MISGCTQPVSQSSTTDDSAVQASETRNMTEKLAPCPASPNCVCSEYSDDSHAVAAFAFDGDAARAWAALRAAVESLPRTKVVSSGADYLKAEARSAVFRFVDDVEFRLDAETGLIHVRSASRVGYSDLGANRKRVEALRERFNQQLALQF